MLLPALVAAFTVASSIKTETLNASFVSTLDIDILFISPLVLAPLVINVVTVSSASVTMFLYIAMLR